LGTGEEEPESDIPAKPKTRVKCTTTDDAGGRVEEEEIRVMVRDWDCRLERESRRGTYLPSRSPEPETMTWEGEPESGEEEIRVRDFSIGEGPSHQGRARVWRGAPHGRGAGDEDPAETTTTVRRCRGKQAAGEGAVQSELIGERESRERGVAEWGEGGRAPGLCPRSPIPGRRAARRALPAAQTRPG
jgi:hypothetical protein